MAQNTSLSIDVKKFSIGNFLADLGGIGNAVHFIFYLATLFVSRRLFMSHILG
jgi:hypothetical protein